MTRRARGTKPVWINDATVAQGYVMLDGNKYTIQRDRYACNEEAERNVLGCILIAGERGRSLEAMKRIGFLHHDDFYWQRNGWIFKAMEGLYQRGDEIDMVTLKNMLAKVPFGKNKTTTFLDEVGGEAYLYQLTNVVAENIDTYARIIVRDALHRALRLSFHRLGQIDSSLELDELLQAADQTIKDVQRRQYAVTEQRSYNLYDALEEHFEQFQRELADDNYEVGVPIGYTGFTKVLGAWRKSKLYIFAAPSGWGKTMLLLCFALNAMFAGKKVLYISLEQSESELYDRLLSIQSSVNHDLISKRDKRMSPQEMARLSEAYKQIHGHAASKDFILTYMNQPTMAQIRAKIDSYYLNPGIDLVILDYANVNTISPEDDRIVQGGNADLRLMTHIYKELEAMKKDFDLPIIAGAQMNQDWDKRKGKRPRQNDLYFGSVGVFAADVIAFIYHPSKANPDNDLINENTAEIVFRKNRAGIVTGDVTVELTYEPQYMRFVDVDKQLSYLREDED